MSNEPEPDDFTFWLAQADRYRSGPTDPRNLDPVSEQEADELDELLWAFAEGELAEGDSGRLWELTARSANVEEQLRKMHMAIVKTAEGPSGSAEAILAKMESRTTSAPATKPTGLVDLAIRLFNDGLEILQTSGSPVYAPAMARSADDAPVTTSALQFLTSVGTVQVTVDHAGDKRCHVTVSLTRVVGRRQPDDFVLVIHAGAESPLRIPLKNGEARVRDLRPASYELLLSDNGTASAIISVDLSS